MGIYALWKNAEAANATISEDIQDADGDSQMGDRTSPSTASEDAMFPATNDEPGSSKAINQPILGGDLSSPPPSQEPAGPEDAFVETMESIDEEAPQSSSRLGNQSDAPYIPGSGWDNRKARDDYQRAWQSMEDKNFSLSSYTPSQQQGYHISLRSLTRFMQRSLGIRSMSLWRKIGQKVEDAGQGIPKQCTAIRVHFWNACPQPL